MGGGLFRGRNEAEGVISELNCTGAEDSIQTCSSNTDSDVIQTCDYAVAVCQGNVRDLFCSAISIHAFFSKPKTFIEPSTSAGDCSYGDVRLVNGSSPLEGRVEICINNAWGSVCTDAVSEDDVEVICRQIGQLPPSMFCIKTYVCMIVVVVTWTGVPHMI